jgi:hypothetical protein
MARYFVSYAHRDGFGAAQVDLTLPVRGMSDVRELATAIERDYLLAREVVPLFWRAFESAQPAAADPGADPAGGVGEGLACPGHVGRGAGVVCVVCSQRIPPALRRSVDSPSELRADCPDCAAGRVHVHAAAPAGGGVR